MGCLTVLEPSSCSVSFCNFLTDGVYGRKPTAVGLTRPSRRCSASRWCRCCLASPPCTSTTQACRSRPGVPPEGAIYSTPRFWQVSQPYLNQRGADFARQQELPDFEIFLRPCHSLKQPNTAAIIGDSGRLRGATGAARAQASPAATADASLAHASRVALQCTAEPDREELEGNVGSFCSV